MRNAEYLRLFGNTDCYSMGTAVVTADKQLKRGLKDGTYDVEEIGNAKAIVKDVESGKWFIHFGGFGNDEIYTAMLGAACGDVIGSVYEWHNIKQVRKMKKLMNAKAHFTDDTVMTLAVAEGLSRGLARLPVDWLSDPEHEKVLTDSVRDAIIKYGRLYPHAGYGGSFRRWLKGNEHPPYGSWGNGSAMRASYAGWVAMSLEEAERLGELSAIVTHDHPEGIKGAKVVAGCIFLLKNQASKGEVRAYAEKYYDLDFTLNKIRKNYKFDVSCQGSVPHAIIAFLENDSFDDVISAAISIGGDSDTIAAIAGSLAEAVYPISQEVRGFVVERLDDFLKKTIVDSVDFMYSRLPD